MSLSKTEFFLGGISLNGFKTHFDEEIKKPYNFTYILKGGAGTGKSTLMKSVAKIFYTKKLSLISDSFLSLITYLLFCRLNIFHYQRNLYYELH